MSEHGYLVARGQVGTGYDSYDIRMNCGWGIREIVWVDYERSITKRVFEIIIDWRRGIVYAGLV